MEKDGEVQQTQNNEYIELGEVELNQAGRPKQKVIFYELTEEMKKELA